MKSTDILLLVQHKYWCVNWLRSLRHSSFLGEKSNLKRGDALNEWILSSLKKGNAFLLFFHWLKFFISRIFFPCFTKSRHFFPYYHYSKANLCSKSKVTAIRHITSNVMSCNCSLGSLDRESSWGQISNLVRAEIFELF